MKMEDVLRKINKVGEDFGKMMSCLPNNYCNGYMQAIRDCKAQFYGDVHIVESDKKVVTNGDRIRNMSDDELSSFLGKTVYYCRGRQDQKYCDACPLYKCGACNEIYIERWLKDKVE